MTLLTWKIFELITSVPDNAMRWLGQGFTPLGNEATKAMGGEVLGAARGQAQNIGSAASRGTTGAARAVGGGIRAGYGRLKKVFGGGGGGNTDNNHHAPTPAQNKAVSSGGDGNHGSSF